MWHQIDEIEWLDFSQLSEIIESATGEEISELMAQLEEGIELVTVLIGEVCLCKTFYLFLELRFVQVRRLKSSHLVVFSFD